MAHSDYNCCKICDKKLDYSSDAKTKEHICDACLDNLAENGLNISTKKQLKIWVESTDKEKIINSLKKIGFNFCMFDNDFDNILKSVDISENDIKEEIKEIEEKKETLSDKIKIATVFKGQKYAQCDVNVIQVSDFKEFIKQLKNKNNYDLVGRGLTHYDMFVEQIDKLAGDRFK